MSQCHRREFVASLSCSVAAVAGCIGRSPGRESPTTTDTTDHSTDTTDHSTDTAHHSTDTTGYHTLPYDVRVSYKWGTSSRTIRVTLTKLDGAGRVVLDERFTLEPGEHVDLDDPIPEAGSYRLEATLRTGASDAVEFERGDEGLYDYEGYLVTIERGIVEIGVVEV